MPIFKDKNTSKSVIILAISFCVLSFLTYKQLLVYLVFDFSFVISALALPFLMTIKRSEKSLRYGLISFSLFLLYGFLPLSSLYFLAVICVAIFIIETQLGKINSLPLILIITISPIVIYLSEITGFEIRLYLSKFSGLTLAQLDSNYSSVGNIILLGEEEFRVDPECMGLKMVLMSLLIPLLFIAFQEKKAKKEFRFSSVIIALSASYLLVILSNFVRILVITLLKSPPDTFLHEAIGMLCFVLYVTIPIWFLIKYLPKKNKNVVTNSNNKKINKTAFYIILTLLASLLIFYQFYNPKKSKTRIHTENNIDFGTSSFQKSNEKLGVTKYWNDKVLIYIKPATNFYSADHSPLVCWKGSGYKIINEQIKTIGTVDVYYGKLQQGDDLLYTAWWYDSGDDKTTSQFRWRIQALLKNKNIGL